VNFDTLFLRGQSGKREQHWVMCFASYYGNVQKLAQENNRDEQTIRNYAKTYWLYMDLRGWAAMSWPVQYRQAQKRELIQLRRDVDYSNWLQVAIRVYHEEMSKRIGYEQALNFLRAGTDTPARTFAGIVGGNDITRVKAFTSAINGLKKALLFPMTRKEKRIMKKALEIAKKRGR